MVAAKDKGKPRKSEYGAEDEEVKTSELTLMWGYADNKSTLRAVDKAGIKPVYAKAGHKMFWRLEANRAYVLYQRKLVKDLNDKTFDIPENVNKKERVSQLDQRRIRQLDVKNAILERQWAPIDALETAITAHNQDWRNSALSIMPKLRRKYPNIDIEALEEINEMLIKMINNKCELRLDEEDYK